MQFSVDKNQMILSSDVCQDGHDVKQLVPQMEQVKENIELKGEEKFSADCGYSDVEKRLFLLNFKTESFDYLFYRR